MKKEIKQMASDMKFRNFNRKNMLGQWRTTKKFYLSKHKKRRENLVFGALSVLISSPGQRSISYRENGKFITHSCSASYDSELVEHKKGVLIRTSKVSNGGDGRCYSTEGCVLPREAIVKAINQDLEENLERNLQNAIKEKKAFRAVIKSRKDFIIKIANFWDSNKEKMTKSELYLMEGLLEAASLDTEIKELEKLLVSKDEVQNEVHSEVHSEEPYFRFGDKIANNPFAALLK